MNYHKKKRPPEIGGFFCLERLLPGAVAIS
jgi:hypothetical protein